MDNSTLFMNKILSSVSMGTASGEVVEARGEGTSEFQLSMGTVPIYLDGILPVPKISHNLPSVPVCARMDTRFSSQGAIVRSGWKETSWMSVGSLMRCEMSTPRYSSNNKTLLPGRRKWEFYTSGMQSLPTVTVVQSIWWQTRLLSRIWTSVRALFWTVVPCASRENEKHAQAIKDLCGRQTWRGNTQRFHGYECAIGR